MDTLTAILDPWGLLLLALVGLVVAGISNGMETGLYRVNRVRLRLRAEGRDRRARILRAMLRDLRGMIVVCLLGYDGGVYLTTAVVTTLVAATGWVETSVGVEILTTAILSPIFFVFTDVTPKSLFAVDADRWVYPLARPMWWAYGLLRGIGLVPALKGASDLVLRLAHKRGLQGANPFTPRERLRAVIREGAAEGVISGYQDELVGKVLGLREQPVQAVMIALRQVTSVPATIGRERFIEELRRHSYTRVPVYENHRDQVVGIVRINDVLARPDGPFDLREIMIRDIITVAPALPVSQALFRLRRARAAMAIVADAQGRAVGIITLKDLVEEIVGELGAW